MATPKDSRISGLDADGVGSEPYRGSGRNLAEVPRQKYLSGIESNEALGFKDRAGPVGTTGPVLNGTQGLGHTDKSDEVFKVESGLKSVYYSNLLSEKFGMSKGFKEPNGSLAGGGGSRSPVGGVGNSFSNDSTMKRSDIHFDTKPRESIGQNSYRNQTSNSKWRTSSQIAYDNYNNDLKYGYFPNSYLRTSEEMRKSTQIAGGPT